MFFERPQSGERAVLVHLHLDEVTAPEDPRELEELALSAGADPVAYIFGHRTAPDLLHLARAGVEARVGTAAPALHDLVAGDARALDQAHDLLDALRVGVVAEVEADDDRRPRIGGCGAFQARRRRPCRSRG